MTKRATLKKVDFHYQVLVDGVYVGRGDHQMCTALMNELNESDEKCDLLIETFAGGN